MQPELDSRRLRRIALTAISIAILFVLSIASCTSTSASSSPAKPSPPLAVTPEARGQARLSQERNQICDLCHEGNDDNVRMKLYVFAPGQPDMDYETGEQMLQGEDSTAMGFSHPGCTDGVALPPGTKPVTFLAQAGAADAGPVDPIQILQAGPPPPRAGSGTDGQPPPPEMMRMKEKGMGQGEHHACRPPEGRPRKHKACREPQVADSYVQDDGVIYYKIVSGAQRDYRFVPCKFNREGQVRSYEDVTSKLGANQWIHFTGTNQDTATGPVYSVARQN
jgi:hypothetical protein